MKLRMARNLSTSAPPTGTGHSVLNFTSSGTLNSSSLAAGANNGTTAGRDLGTGLTTVNLKTTYGAVGDGVADDTAALSTALNAIGGKALYIPAGTYKTTAHVTMLGAKNNFRIYGDGPNLSIIKPVTQADTAIIFGQSYNFKLYDFAIKAINQPSRTSTTNGRGIHLDICHDYDITNVLVDAVSGAGILHYRCYNGSIHHCTIQNTLADACHFSGTGSHDLGAFFSKVINSGDDAFASIGYNPYKINLIEFSDNEVYDAWWGSGCSFEGTTNAKCYRNKIYRTGIGGIRIAAETSYATGYSDNIDVRDNYLEGCVTRTTTGHASMSAHTSTSGETITNATFVNNTIVNPASGPFFRAWVTSPGGAITITLTDNTMTGTGSAYSGATITRISGNTLNGSPAP